MESAKQAPLTFHEVLSKVDIKVISGDTFDYVGKFDNTLIETMISFLHDCTTGDVDQFKQLRDNIEIFLRRSTTAKATWITIRLWKGHKQFPCFDTPRWHRDGPMFMNGNSEKYAVALLGPDTMLLDESGLDISKETMEKTYDEKAVLFRDVNRIVLEEHQIFQFSCMKDCPVHSEPRIDSNRIFISCVPGTEEQIRDLCRIRSWKYGGVLQR